MFAASKSGRAVAGADTDPFFDNVPLLLNTTSTNGQTNNTFLDSSTNNFTITRNGTATQGSVTPYWPNGYWSWYFSGSGFNQALTSSTPITATTSTFTIECWIAPTAAFVGSIPAVIGDAASAFLNYLSFGPTSANTLQLYWTDAGGGKTCTGNTTILLGEWTHIAVSVNANAISLYVNGVAQTLSGTTTLTTRNGTTNQFVIGYVQAGTNIYSGYISNLSVLSGTAKYSIGFTPSTTPLSVSTTNQTLLTCYSNRFIDSNTATSAKTISINGTAKIQPFQPFSPVASYTPAAYGGSGYFIRASTQYLTVSNSGGQFSFGTGALTIECWVNLSALPSASGYPGSYWMIGGGPLNSNTGIDFYINPTQIGFNLVDFTSPTAIGNHGMVVGAWYHVAVVRGGASNQTVSIYVNGTRVATATSVTATADVATTGIAISAAEPSGSTSGNFDGYISNYRIVKGTAVYDPTLTTLTVPTSPLTAITNTSLLLNFTNAGIYDAAVQNNAITVGDAQASTTQKQWSPTSMKFDGAGDYLYVPWSPSLEFGSNNFTIEFWAWIGGGNSIYCWSTDYHYGLSYNYGGATSNRVGVWASSNGSSWNIFNADPAGNGVSTGTISTSTWTHVALVRSGSSWALFLNGTRGWTGTSSATLITRNTDTFRIGGPWPGAGPADFSGYIQDFRITNGIARYNPASTTITVPTSAFPTR